MIPAERYPRNIKNYKEVYGYGGVRIYQVSKEQANEIVKEIPEHFKYTPAFAQSANSDRLFYMNVVNHGEQHIIFSIAV